MRKFYLLTVATLCLSLTSCLKGTEVKESAVIGGIEMYTPVFYQNDVVLDPANIAFRLNTLLIAMQESDNPNVTFDNVTVTIDSKEIKLKEQLFGGATIKEKEKGIYQIYFDADNYPANDVPHEGSVTINTGGKTIPEMELEGNSWSIINTPTHKYKVYPYGKSASCYTIDLSSGYYIYPIMMDNTWKITNSGGDFICSDSRTSDKYPSAWTFDYILTMTKGSLAYADVLGAEFTLACDYASGKAVNTDVSFSYKTEPMSPLIIKVACKPTSSGKYYPAGGREYVECRELTQLNPVRYPESSVSVQWKQGEKDCSSTADFIYNGFMETISFR